MSIYRSVGVVVGLVCLAFVCGCIQSGSSTPTTAPTTAPAASTDTSPKAILVTAGNGGSVLYITSTDGTSNLMTTEGAPTCNQCATDAQEYFKTGHIDPVCAVCGAHRTVLNLGHQ
jgi:hypothetical protein